MSFYLTGFAYAGDIVVTNDNETIPVIGICVFDGFYTGVCVAVKPQLLSILPNGKPCSQA